MPFIVFLLNPPPFCQARTFLLNHWLRKRYDENNFSSKSSKPKPKYFCQHLKKTANYDNLLKIVGEKGGFCCKLTKYQFSSIGHLVWFFDNGLNGFWRDFLVSLHEVWIYYGEIGSILKCRICSMKLCVMHWQSILTKIYTSVCIIKLGVMDLAFWETINFLPLPCTAQQIVWPGVSTWTVEKVKAYMNCIF